ncbi:cholinesterase-like [Ptychodera flava]|uniref:cholinesterase-like n=1 Tax=Ptychodera flava TaxID=63121 RepID=UPI00396A85AE
MQLGLLITLVSFGYVSCHDDPPVVNTKYGPVRGRRISTLGQEIEVFLSIPYAKPPLGDLRFLPPQPAVPWNETLDTVEFKTSCFQKHDRNNTGPLPLSEDCLLLNVWTPRGHSESAAVMVYIHGGGFTWGRAEKPEIRGSIIAATQQVIVVSMNYRLGVFGFLALDSPDSPGNMGLLDQQFAMAWVRENIHAFGGDPEKITIFGHSAGGASVGYHLLSPGSQSLYRRAIVQSGYVLNPRRAFISKDEAFTRGLDLARQVGCLDSASNNIQNVAPILECLKEKPAEELISVQKPFTMFKTPFPPVIDGTFITEAPRVLAGKKEFKKTSLLMGVVKHESSDMTFRINLPSFSPGSDFLMTYEEFQNLVKFFYPYIEDTQSITSHYVKSPASIDGSQLRSTLIDLNSDQGYICPSLELASVYTDAGQDVYFYNFDHRPSLSKVPEWMGIVHGDELEYIFGLPLVDENFTNKEVQLSQKMMEFWANFAKTGNPNKGHENEIDSNQWPAYGKKKQYYVLNGKTVHDPLILTNLRGYYCNFWKKQSAFQVNDEEQSNTIERDEL